LLLFDHTISYNLLLFDHTISYNLLFDHTISNTLKVLGVALYNACLVLKLSNVYAILHVLGT